MYLRDEIGGLFIEEQVRTMPTLSLLSIAEHG